jgi:hypothetical protein
MPTPVKRLLLGLVAAATLSFVAPLSGFAGSASACDASHCKPAPESIVSQVNQAVAGYQQWYLNLLNQPSPFFPMESANKQLSIFIRSIFSILGINAP